MSGKMILYDLTNKQGKSWSPNPWKSRLALNFKNVSYTTEWLEYPELAPKLSALGIPPNDPGSFADYSSPAVRFADGTYVMDSAKIVQKLEATYPEPSLYLDPSADGKIETLVSQALMALVSSVYLNIVNDILQEPSKSWFTEDRERRYGMSLQEVERNLGGEAAWQQAEPALSELKGMLASSKKDHGPFLLGSKPSYGDLIIVALFEGVRRVSPGEHERLVKYGSFKKLYEACKQWTEKDD